MLLKQDTLKKFKLVKLYSEIIPYLNPVLNGKKPRKPIKNTQKASFVNNFN
jgi:hypothetical protein